MASSDFAIYPLAVGDGKLAISPIPGRFGCYQTDLRILQSWAPDLVITLTSQDELDGQGAGALGADLAEKRINWRHLPVRDFDIPDDLDWPALRQEILAVLAGGGRILVHCFGGCGRSGMLVLRCMIAAGTPPDAALRRLRDMRPCAVETKAQMDWALQDGD
ncbi:protein-tyrosine phosphatase family protein [Yoonia sp. BS5-3]|uniref:Protein-tyrosine phosphatase family protein n=1 Tax=Yoonia phaeophyticola TaxID=3137369 RepID=A0ABZ2V3M5_9RHOB